MLEPIGMIRENSFQANIAKTIIDAKWPEHELQFSDFMLFQPEEEKTQEDVMDAIKARMAGLC